MGPGAGRGWGARGSRGGRGFCASERGGQVCPYRSVVGVLVSISSCTGISRRASRSFSLTRDLPASQTELRASPQGDLLTPQGTWNQQILLGRKSLKGVRRLREPSGETGRPHTQEQYPRNTPLPLGVDRAAHTVTWHRGPESPAATLEEERLPAAPPRSVSCFNSVCAEQTQGCPLFPPPLHSPPSQPPWPPSASETTSAGF